MSTVSSVVFYCSHYTHWVSRYDQRFGQYLEVPKPNRMFLISPPSSPPVGWEPIEEDGPVINYELLAAIATLASEEEAIVELCPGSDTTPQLIVKCI